MKKTIKLPWIAGVIVSIALIPFMGVVAAFILAVFAFVMVAVGIAALCGKLTVTTTGDSR